MRTFIAIDLSPEIKTRLAQLVARLEPLGGGIKWVTTESMHITLKFLGEVDASRAAAVQDMLQTATARFDSVPLACKGTGYFPSGSKSPRVLWVGVEADPSLALLQEEIEAGCMRLGFERESRPFHPHLTLGRVKTLAAMGRVILEFEKTREEAFGEMSVRSVALFESRLRPSGAEYSILREFALR